MDWRTTILQSMDYIEEHLSEELTLEQIAEEIHYSKFHYARIFKEILGENIGDYQRKRRLTQAAQELLSGDQGIIDIAIRYGYQSQEAFTRMFKGYFGVTPKKYRKDGIPYDNLYKYPVRPEDLEWRNLSGQLKYSIVHKPSFELVGLSYHGANKKHEVARIFNEAAKRLNLASIYPEYGGFYGLESCDVGKSEQEEFDFLAGIEANYVTVDRADLVSRRIPENEYAVFELTSSIEKIREQTHQIYISLLNDEKYQLIDQYAFEFYPTDFVPNQPGKSAYLYLPVVKIAR